MSPTPPTFFSAAAEFRAWLAAHAATAPALLVGFHKVGSGRPHMTWSQSVDEALCVGWIDGVRRRIDEHAYCIRFSPRKPGSIWSAVNIAKVAQLQAEGRMTVAGERAFALRREDRSAIYAFEQPGMPELAPAEWQALQADAATWAYYEATPPGYRKQMLHRIVSARKPETRARRFALLLQACAEGHRLE